MDLGRDELSNVTTVSLQVEVTKFQSGKLRLECVVQLYDVYSSAQELWLDEDRPRLASVLSTRDSSTAGNLALLKYYET